MNTKEKLLDISMLLGTAAAVLISAFAGFAKECDELRDKTFRLHIPANSDSAEDQLIKYEVRDFILGDLGVIFTSCGSKEEAKALAQRNIGYIDQRVNDFLRSKGADYTAECSVVTTEFPTRAYGDYTLPAGTYDALRVVIGKGEGKNWWCVLYPSVCIKAASVPAADGSLPAVKQIFPRRELYESRKRANSMTADSLAAEHGKVEYKFALYELIKGLFKIDN